MMHNAQLFNAYSALNFNKNIVQLSGGKSRRKVVLFYSLKALERSQ